MEQSLKLFILPAKTLSIIWLLLICRQCWSQTEIPCTFNQRVDASGGLPDSGLKSVFWNSGYLTMGYFYDTTDYHEGLTLTYFDSTGAVVWNRHYTHPDYYYLQANDLAADSDSSFFVAGLAYLEEENRLQPFFAGFDVNGDSTVFRVIGDTAPGMFIRVLPFRPDTLLVMGFRQPLSNTAYETTLLYKMTAQGEIVDSAALPTTLKSAYGLFVSNERIYIGGTQRTSAYDPYHVNLYVDMYDTEFNHVRTWYPTNVLNESFADFTVKDDQVFVLSSWLTYNEFGSPVYQHRIGKLDTTSQYYIHFKDIGIPDYTYSNSLGSLHWIGDKLVIPYMINHPKPINYVKFTDASFQFDCDGRIPIDTTLSMWPNMSSLEIGPNGKGLSTGYFYALDTTENQDQWMFLTENLLDFMIANCDQPLSLSENTHDFGLSPNPFSTELTIRTAVPEQHLDVLLTDQSGNLLRSLRNLSGSEFKVPREGLSGGLYLVTILVDSRPVYHGKVVVAD